MTSSEFSPGDLVWAKMKGYPPWPGKVVAPPAGMKPPTKPKKPHHYVLFFGSDNHAWILDENISHHSDSMVPENMKKKSAQFVSAVEIIASESKKHPKKMKQGVSSKKSSPEASTSHKKTAHVSEEPKKKKVDKGQSSSSHSAEKKSKPKKNVPKKSAKKRSHEEIEEVDDRLPTYSANGRDSANDEYSALLASVPPNMSFKDEPGYEDPPFQSPSQLEHPSYVARPPSPALDIQAICEILNTKRSRPSDKKIGFLGLGSMGRGIVKNLLSSGHEVTIWNRTQEKCDDFVKAGAKRGQSPADVVFLSDITFCCVADPEAVKSIVFGNSGVLDGLDKGGVGKGYVEMTSVDPDTCTEIAEAIIRKGGTYLEAHINGSKQMAENGTLCILVAGNRDLFTDCSTCFQAISKHAYYISSTIGTGSQMNLALNMLHGSMCASLGEAMSLVERLKLSQNDFMEIVELSALMCPVFQEKGHSILHKDFSPSITLKHVQNDLRMAINLGEQCDQPTPVAAASNQVYKHAMLLKYEDHDVSAVYQGSRY